MMPAPHGQAILIGECGEIVRMRRVHDKSNKRAALISWPENARAGQFSETLGRIARKLRVVLENCRASNLLEVINRCREADRAGDIRRAGLKPMGRFLKRGFFQGDAHDHCAAAMVWRHGIKNLRACVEGSDAGACTNFVRGKFEECAVKLANVDWKISSPSR